MAPSLPPAWSPDGQTIALSAVRLGEGGRVLFVDSQTGSLQEVPSLTGVSGGLGWLDAQSLALNELPQFGGLKPVVPVPYPAGPVVRLQNDPNDYFGVSLSSNRRDLVTSRRDARMDVWIGDGGGATGSTVAQHVKVSIPRIAWSGDRLLYGGNVGGKATILGTTAGATTSDAVLSDGLTPAATRDGGTIVFVSPRLDLWTADASGRRLTQLVAGVSAAEVAVTPNDRDVLFTRVGETVSIWTVPLAGGKPARLVDGADAAAISPDGRTLAFVAHGSGEQAALLRVCGLPGCISSRPIGAATSETSISWTPDGSGVAFARDGNLWVQATEGGASRPLTRFTDTRPIGSFAWSRDGTRLAITRITVTNDIVLFKGLARE